MYSISIEVNVSHIYSHTLSLQYPDKPNIGKSTVSFSVRSSTELMTTSGKVTKDFVHFYFKNMQRWSFTAKATLAELL